MHNISKYTRGEEIANAVTHGVGALLAAAALSLLVVLASIYGNVWAVVSFSVYGATLILLYLFSTLYHSFQNPKVKQIFRIMDHSSIYLLIAGTYTPFMLVPLRGPIGWTIFGIIWGLALAGIIFKIFFINRFRIISTTIYILMGWAILFAIKPLAILISTNGIKLLVAGGILYTLGGILYVFKKIKYSHAIFHMFILAGSICHFFAVLLCVIPLRG